MRRWRNERMPPAFAAVCRLSTAAVFVVGGMAITPRLAAYSVDAGTGAAVFREKIAEPFGIGGQEVRWQRVRGLPNPETAGADAVANAREELRAIRARGIRSAVMLRFNNPSWATGARTGAGQRMPLDLREAFARGRAFAAAYGDLVDAWEIDNEPDISFVEDNPEAFTAYFKAFGLGLRSKPETGNLKPECEDQATRASEPIQDGELSAGGLGAGLKFPPSLSARRWPVKTFFGGGSALGFTQLSGFRSQPSAAATPPLVLMAPLAYPPGPWLERSMRNDLLSYTDGFNYHFYGYAEDFTGVYRQFEDAVTRVAREVDGELWTVDGGQGTVGGGQGTVDGRRETGDGGQGTVDGEQWTVDGRQTADGGQRRAEGGRQRADGGQGTVEGEGDTREAPAGGSQLSTLNSQPIHPPSDERLTRSLPVFLTEYGYGSMSGPQAQTVEGRVRQWRWFADVLPQVRALRIEAPMAFVAMPYLEHGYNEFGLMMKAEPLGKPETGNLKPELKPVGKPDGGGRVQKAEGQEPRAESKTADGSRSRAAASRMSGPNSSSGFRSQVSGFVPRQSSAAPPSSFTYGQGSLVLYNFSNETVSGRLELPEGFEIRELGDSGRALRKAESGERTGKAQSQEPGAESHESGAKSQESRAESRRIEAGGKADGSRATVDSGRPVGAKRPLSTLNPQRSTSDSQPSTLNSPAFEAGGVVFAPGDFGAKRVEPWMRRIGAPPQSGTEAAASGQWEASPAAAYLWDYAARHPYRPRPWTVRVAPASPVVIDFLPGEGLQQYKAAGGYAVGGVVSVDSGRETVDSGRRAVGGGLSKPENATEAAGRQFDNLKPEERVRTSASGAQHSGSIPSSGFKFQVSGLNSVAVRLPPGDRLVLPIRIRVQAERFALETVSVRFVSENDAQPVARWSTRLVPQAVGMKSQVVARFDHPAEAAESARQRLLERPLAREEPPRMPQGRWLVSEGVSLLADSADGEQWTVDSGQSTGDGGRSGGAERRLSTLNPQLSTHRRPPSDTWRFRVDSYAPMTLGSAMAELPLPEGFRFDPGTVLSLQYRIEAAAPVNPQRPHMLQVQVRTANGNLYEVWPWVRPTAQWRPYWQHSDNFTMAFFGRAALPWRFQDNEPVSLVFCFRPGSLPATFEFSKVQLLRWERGMLKPET